MKTTVDTTKNALIKKFHTLIHKYNVTQENKRLILDSFGVESTKDLNVSELIEACDALQNRGKAADDQCRKRLIAAIYGWAKKMGKPDASQELVKGIACKAAGVERYNQIPIERLRSLYYAFSKKAKDLDLVSEITAAEIDKLIHCN